MSEMQDRHASKNGLLYEDLVVGRRYRVSWDDCCASGWFEGTLVEQEEWSLRFDCGELSLLADGRTWITAADHE